MIRRLFRILGSAIAITIMVAIGFSLLIWFIGPLIGFGESHPWQGVLSRLITIAIIFLIGMSVMLAIVLRRARNDKAMAQEIVESAQAATVEGQSEEVKAELGDVKNKLQAAMTTLRKSKFGRKHLYELPWYVMIGPPGAGKTTAIVNSGLKFPLADTMGKSAIGGVGGTRNCDWWFTDNAVLIDTAGRYTTQDSAADEDNAGWLGFLKLLKRHRKRQPINGAIVAISLADLSLQDEQTQASHAQAIRARLHELRERLGVRFPVYVLFTKSDLVAGFSEYFDTLGKEERGQVWGFTLPMAKGAAKDQAGGEKFDEEFDLLLAQLNAQSLERMQQETDHQRRSLISNFPAQVASVRETARGFLDEIFQGSRHEESHLLRGIYFTSGTQEGTPIDRLMMGMARTFGIGRQAIGSGSGAGRSYFLTELFNNVIFREAGLVSADDRLERRYKWAKWSAVTMAIICAIGISALWVRSYLGNAALVAEVDQDIASYQLAVAQVPPSPIQDSDIPGVVPTLNILAEMPANSASGATAPERALTYGLYQGGVLGNQVALTYRSALNQHFLPRLILRLEDQMQANMNNPDFLYESLKVYLMLGQQGPMSQSLVRDWMQLDWEVSFPGDARAVLRGDLDAHVAALVSGPMHQIGLNGPLVEQIQGLLSEMPLAQRVYNGIINSSRVSDLQDWRLTDVGGPAVSRVIVRSSGKPLNEGIEGIFTHQGFNNVFLDEALGVAKRVQRESWVLGPRGISEQSDAALTALSRDVLDLYYNDFVSRYDQLLGDIDIIPMESLSHAVEVTNVLSGPTSPLTNILTAISQETKLTQQIAASGTAGLAEGAKEIGQLELQSSLTSRSQLFLEALRNSTSGTQGEAPKEPGQYVEDRFSWLHQLVTQVDGQPSQLDELMGRLTQVYQELNKLSFAGEGGNAEISAMVRFQELANRLPGPIQRWSAQITSGSSGITADGTRASINAKWQSEVLSFCEQALGNRYPFDRRAQADVAIPDFARLFAPGGLIDSFITENLAGHIDTRARPWAWKRVNGTDLGMSPAVLLQMQYATEIRDAFFGGGDQVAVRFQLTPEALDPKAREVTLEIDGQTILFKHNQSPKPTAIQWPGSVGAASVQFKPGRANSGNVLARQGPWAWFRLLDAAEIRNTNVSDRSRVIFNVGGRISIFQLQSGSVINPFSLAALRKFSCPKSF